MEPETTLQFYKTSPVFVIQKERQKYIPILVNN
jgi:hypothetical protein